MGNAMNQRDRNNLKADATHDQAMACIRDGVAIPDDMDLRASAARLPLDGIPEAMKDVCRDLKELWAEQTDVDMIE